MLAPSEAWRVERVTCLPKRQEIPPAQSLTSRAEQSLPCTPGNRAREAEAEGC